jgi:hypothetical protein
MTCRSRPGCPAAASIRRLPPMRPRSWCAGNPFRWSGACRATLSGAVSAGSNPAVGTGQRHKFEHSDNLGLTQPQACDLRQRRDVPDLAPESPPEAEPSRGKSQLTGQPCRRPPGRCPDQRPLLFGQYPQLDSSRQCGADDAGGGRPARPVVSVATWSRLTLRHKRSAFHAPDPPYARLVGHPLCWSTCHRPGRSVRTSGGVQRDACLPGTALCSPAIIIWNSGKLRSSPGYSLIWRMPRALVAGSMIQAAQAKPMSAMPSSVFSPGVS